MLMRRRGRDGKHGQILVLFTLVVVLLMVLAAVVIDVGLLRTDSARLRNALDAAALAGAYDLPATSANHVAIETASTNTAQASYGGMGSANVPNPTITYACLIGYDTVTHLPRVGDMSAGVCVVPFAASDANWRCVATGCWAPCLPAVAGQKCNTIIVTDSATRDYQFGRVVGINSGGTGAVVSAACNGACGGPPTTPVDVVLNIDRTGSMSGEETNLQNGAEAVLEAYNPDVQHVALGLIGPSSQINHCSNGAYGMILENGSLTAPSIGSSHPTGTNVSAGANSLAISRPSSTAAGDLLLAGITVDGGTGTSITPPSGWTLIRRTDNGVGVGLATYEKLATGSEPASYTWGLSPSVRATGGILRLTNVDTAQPIDLSSVNTGSVATLTASGITTTVDATTLVGFFSPDSNSAVTPSGGSTLTEQFDVAHPNASGPRTEVATRTLTTAGASGNKTATITAGALWAAQLIAVRPMPVESYPTQYPTTTPPFSTTFLDANMGKWIPVGLTGTSNADVIESYQNADGTVRAASLIDRTILCALSTTLYSGTDQASPLDFATRYLTTHARINPDTGLRVKTGIIFETDGRPQLQNFTCQQAQTAAAAAKAAGIEVFMIAFFAGGSSGTSPGTACPDSSGAWQGKTIVTSLAAMATDSTTPSTTACDPATENTDGDHFFCTPDPTQLADVFRAAAVQLAGGAKLVQLFPIPLVTGVGPSTGPKAGGTSVTITGQFFIGATSVTFGGTGASAFTVNGDTSITATAPVGAANATVDIKVTTAGGTSPIVSADKYTYGP